MPNIDEKITWPGWETVRLIGRGSFGAVYEIERDVLGDKEKAALKVISIPQSDSDISEMYSDGYDDESITSTFKEHLKSIVAEYSLMRKLNGSANVVNCDDVRYVQHDDGFGWDIFIKMELLTPLTAALPADVSEDQIIKIAKDLCRALVQCRQFGIVHRDIKPQNIFVSPLGDYKLGDFGIAKTVEKTSGGTKIGTYKYMAPEVYNNQPYGAGADIYSLGLVLYWLLNERRMPFLPLPPEKLRARLEEEARLRRFRGEPIPAPAHGSEELKRIVLKACAYDPKDRYQSAEEVLRELEAVGAPAYSIPSSKIAAGYEDACLNQSGRAENDEDSTVSAMHLADTVPDENETIDIFHMDCPAREIDKQDISAVSEKETEEQSEDATVSAYGTQKEKSIEPVPQKAKKPIGTVIAAIATLAAIIAVFIWAPWKNQAGTSTGIGASVANDSVLPTTPVVSETPMSSEASAESDPSADAPAEGWAPDGPVTMIVAYKAGNSTDVTARILAQYAEKYIGQTVIVENVDGGSGSLGWSQLAEAEADGMTIGFMNLPNFNRSIVKELGTYTTADFTAICNHVTETSLVIVRANEDRFEDIDGLVAYARENDTIASTNGAQASNHIGAQAFANSAGFKYTDLPQGNTTDELTSLLGGGADWCVAKDADIVGRTDVKVLASFSEERLPEYPDVPTLGEKGYYDQWLGSSRCIVAPAGVTEEMVAFYEAAFKAAMEDPEYLEATASFVTDFRDAVTTTALIEQQQAFAEGLSEDFWKEPQSLAEIIMTAQDSMLGVVIWRDENWPADFEFMQSVQTICEANEIPCTFKRMVPEGQECYEAALQLVDEGCTVIISNDNVHEFYLAQAAREVPDVDFWQLNGALASSENLDNFHNL